jgi:hypothetical protein
MQYDRKKGMRAQKQGLANRPFPGRSNGGPADAKRSYERFMALARSAADAVEMEYYYQHAEHYFRLMRLHGV